MAGIQFRNQRPFQQMPQQPNAESAYAASIPQQAEDYDSIMGGYRDLLNNSGASLDDVANRYRNFLDSSESKFQPAQYTQAPEWGEAYNKLKELAENGGLDAQGQADLRARGISPIRAVYANAQRGVDRQRALQGGYSANHGAVSAKMAREQSESIAGATTNVNATIAKMVQEGKLKATPELANMASGKNTLMNQIGMANSENQLRASANKTAALAGYGNAVNNKSQIPLDALKGMTSLYGTTPALVNTFGNQTQNNQQMTNQQRQQTSNNLNDMLRSVRMRRY
jgi:hypothetical protein